MPKGGRRAGAGRPPAGGEIRALIREAAGILSHDAMLLHQIAAAAGLDHEHTPEALELVAKATARDGMLASRRIAKAARKMRQLSQ